MNKYDDLSYVEKLIFIGEFTHCVTNDEKSFNNAAKLINDARQRGVLDNVTLMPETSWDTQTR